MAKASLDLWVYKNGNLTFVQGSVPFKVDVVKLEQSEFRVRVHGQDGPYELAMVPAEQPVFE